ncbi:MAG: efflux transporter outer membrane subunit [Candidatus Acidiferrales bacterium]
MLERKAFLLFLFATGIVSLAGCTVGPKYERATAPTAAKWEVAPPWRQSAPKDAIPKGEWWSVFRDDELSSLEKDALGANQTLQAAIGNYNQARSAAAIQVATNFPIFGVFPSAQRQRLSGNRPSGGSPFPLQPTTQNTFTLPFTVGYEVDLFGQRRRTIEAAEASYQASAADLENVRLVITADLAGDYFSLRQLDSELGILNRTVDTLRRGLQLVDSRHKGGVASGLDVAQEETLLQTTRTQATLLLQQRKQFEDAIAVLVGKPAPDFHIPNRELNAEPPPLDLGLPSDLLERRPDIARAERQMAVANAQIGVAKAAYYPSLNLFGTGGWQAADILKLANVSSTFWALGANVAESIFTGGARRAQVEFAKSGYDVSVANYRQSVLSAFQEVQDDVTGLTVLEQARDTQELAVDAARRTLDLSLDRYRGGLVSYLDVVTAQQNLLINQQEAAIIQGQRLVTSVLLVKALGGGWDASSLAAIQVKPKLKDIVAP